MSSFLIRSLPIQMCKLGLNTLPPTSRNLYPWPPLPWSAIGSAYPREERRCMETSLSSKWWCNWHTGKMYVFWRVPQMKIRVWEAGAWRNTAGDWRKVKNEHDGGVLPWHDLQIPEGWDPVPSLVPPCTGWQKVASEPNSSIGPNSLMPYCFSKLLEAIRKWYG